MEAKDYINALTYYEWHDIPDSAEIIELIDCNNDGQCGFLLNEFNQFMRVTERNLMPKSE